ncbi:hypothetical protein GQ44DRAFT_682358 [Phaeosphaeriaceae sp. PMI808]|nr:hypothetical protein GQ44DRAFT_682358 [Phaeosphaeriaceae sp. PMI808]
MNPGRIVAALASGTQETTLALAQINFDFSLVRFDAPASFHGVGNLLSRKRKVSAESGSSHVTARKLGALFEQLLPNTPLLIDRYGSRASEIALMSKDGEATNPLHSMFAEQAGIDATSIWAAATSGTASIAVHLLACMLARIFPGPEATSIWAELIEERKKELACEDSSKPYHIATMLAAQISIPREQLAEWDNSARSWLRVADETKSVQQTQLLLIIKNIHVPVNHGKGNMYQSVISAWVRALELMENLLRGTAQCVTPFEGNGDLLLALASWHIYPDMGVLGSKRVSQKDSLVPSGAILTVGVECSPAHQDIGVYWSLPLAHFRFYGPPKTAAHSLCTDAERVSFDHFRFVVLGSFLSNWNSPDYQDLELIDHVKMIVKIYDYLTNRTLTILKSRANWLRNLSKTCKELLNASEAKKVIYERLIGVGIRRGAEFLEKQPPFFGLDCFHKFFSMLDGVEAKIAALRRLATKLDLSDFDPLIRYRDQDYNREGNLVKEPSYFDFRPDSTASIQRFEDWLGSQEMEHVDSMYYRYASVIPSKRSSVKRSSEGTEIRNLTHHRWIVPGGSQPLSEIHVGEDVLNLKELGLQISDDDKIKMVGHGMSARKIMAGDPNECALFTTGKPFEMDLTPDDITWALDNGAIDRVELAAFLSSGGPRNQSPTQAKNQGLVRRALAVVSEIYAQFPKVTVALNVIDRPLRQQKWVKLSGLFPLKLARSGCFALLAVFETGTLDPDPSTLHQVMAISSGDSLFVATHLLVGPWDSQKLKSSSICRIRGNIGRPGIAMMVPPPDLQMKQRNSANWQLINHTPFDGVLMDSFTGTSLHLSFTEYNRPVDLGIHGVRDADMYFIEAYVQVCFKGKWIGDIDIISGSENKNFHIFDPELLSLNEPCLHAAKGIRAFRVVAVDNWDEFIDNPKDGIVVRAKDNWLARLAAANLSVQRQYKTIILRSSDSVCWPCVRDHFKFGSSVAGTTIIC